MKPKITLLLLFILLGFNNVFSQNPFPPGKPDLRLCGSAPNYYLDYYNCTSNNYTLNNVYLSVEADINGDGIPDSLADQTCSLTPTPQVFTNVSIVLHYTSNSSSNIENVRLFADLSNNGVMSQINFNLGTVTSGQGTRVIASGITWTCGTAINLSRILVVWKTGGSPTELVPYTCSTYSKSQCELPGSTIIATPLAVQFNYTLCNSATQATVNFNDFTNGGTPPYTYLWNFGDGTTSTLADPQHVYQPPLSSSYTVTLTVTDSHLPNHLVSSQTQTITLNGQIAISGIVNAASCGNQNNGSIDVSVTGGTAPYSYSWNNGAITQDLTGLAPGSYTITVTDAFGCVKSQTFVIGPGDVSNPVVTAPNDLTIEGCGTSAMAGSSALGNLGFSTSPVVISLAQLAAAGVTFVDASAIATITYQDVASGSCPTIVTRTFRLTDACGNVGSDQQIITIDDTTLPVIATLPVPTTINCPAVPQFAQATATDNCTIASLTFNDVTTPGQCAGAYSVTRTWTALDTCGNSATASQTITVRDVSGPVIAALPAPSTINCPAVPQFAQATATDTCGSAFTLTFNDVTTPGQCAGAYSVTRTWTALDACGNSSTASQTINVRDISAPVIAALPAPSTINCPAVPQFAQATATDNCGSAFTLTFNDVTTPGQCAGAYSVTRTWTALDACGNSSTASQTINVRDVTAPVIAALPAPITINCPVVPQFAQATATDNCGSSISLTYIDKNIPGPCAGSYSMIRVWIAQDGCGNSSTASQIINVQDISAPVIAALPAPSTINCPAVPQFAQATATDNCGSAFTLTYVDVRTDGNCIGSYSVTRTWTATDACGNSSTKSQTINVQDVTAPVPPQAPANITVSCSGDIPQMISLTANDACNGPITVLGVDAITGGSCSGSFTVTRTWRFVDSCGNPSSVSQTINVNDSSSPVLPTPPANVTVSCISEVPAMISLTATDTCAGQISVPGVDTVVPGNCPNSFIITRTWTFADPCGNSDSVSQTITVTDNVAPIVPSAPANVTVSCGSLIPEMVSLTADDVCAGPITVQGVDSTVPGNCANSYVVTRTWTFVDACGNRSSVSQIITVNDNIPPVAPLAPADVTVSCGTLIPAMVSLTADDACSGPITVQGVDSTVPGNCVNSYVVTRTWTFVDACGNRSSVSQIINVNDNIPPVAPSAPADVTVSCGSLIPPMVSLTADDACSGPITVQGVDSTVPGNCVNSYVVTRTWTFVDACGNPSSVSQVITVSDTIPPVAPEAPADITVSCGTLIPAMISLTATDNCQDEITVEGIDRTTLGECDNSYVVVRTWTFTDSCGNSSSVSQTITVFDEIAPIAPEAPADITVSCGIEIPRPVTLIADDNCSGEISAQPVDTVQQGDCLNSYVVTRTWTFVDACQNSSSISQTITVSDQIAPVAPAAPENITVECAGDVPAMISLTAYDNCLEEITVEGVDSIVQGDCANSFVVTRTWTFRDACGNESSTAQTITVSDEVAPILPEAPSNITVSCSSDVPRPGVLIANDKCSGEISALGVDVIVQGDCPNAFTVTRTWTFTDGCNNTSSISQVITVNDEIGPSWESLDYTEETTVSCTGIPPVPEIIFTDNCSGEVTVVFAQIIQNEVTDENNLIVSYDIIRTWTATDICGNPTTLTQSIHVTVNDTFDGGVKSICNEVPVNANFDLNQFLTGLVSQDEYDGEWSIENAGFESALNGSILNVIPLPEGYYTLVYTLDTNDSECPRVYEFYVHIYNCRGVVLAACSIEVFNAVSPNDDTMNDILFIQGLDCYPDNNVQIYNRWGVLVFEKNGYNNTSVVFEGKSNGRSTFNKDEELPDGTYFYVLKYKDNETGAWNDKSGYLYLNR